MKEVVVIGVGPGNPELMTISAVQALSSADLILGAKRLLEGLPDCDTALRMEAVRREDILEALHIHTQWQTACILLSGDIGMFSGARPLLEHLDGYQVRTIPGISSMQYLAAKLDRSWQEWRLVTAHGASCNIGAEMLEGGEVFFITGGQHTAGSLCKDLCRAGLGDCLVTVGERLSYPEENITTGQAEELAGKEFDPLSVILVERPAASLWPWANTGIPDDCFFRGDVPMTKQEVRAIALAKLRIAPGDVGYDVGGGTGSVAVEMALLAKKGKVFAIERNPHALPLVQKNKQAFGCTNLHIVKGSAPDALSVLPPPDAVFVGGSGGSLSGILEAVREKNSLVRICVSCITLETLTEATRLLSGEGYQNFEACQIGVSRTHTAGGYQMLKAQNQVFLVSAQGACP